MKLNFHYFNSFFCIILLNFLIKSIDLQAQNSQNRLFLELNSPLFGNGMFNVFSMVIGLLHLYEVSDLAGVKVDFKDEGIYYDKNYGPNWWEYYFEPIQIGSEINSIHQMTTIADQCNLSGLCEFQLSRERVSELIQKYVRLKPHLQSKLIAFQQKNFGRSFIIGVHFRGTDKFSEAPRVSFDKVKERVNRIIRAVSGRDVKIFVATDEQSFLEYMIEQFPQVIFVEDGIRSINGQSVHHYCLENYKKGEDAILDCLLLSKCSILVRTSSSLSLFSSYFNPTLPVINLSYRNGWN